MFCEVVCCKQKLFFKKLNFHTCPKNKLNRLFRNIFSGINSKLVSLTFNSKKIMKNKLRNFVLGTFFFQNSNFLSTIIMKNNLKPDNYINGKTTKNKLKLNKLSNLMYNYCYSELKQFEINSVF